MVRQRPPRYQAAGDDTALAVPPLHILTDPATEAAAGPVHCFARLVEARQRNDAAEGRRRVSELRKLGYVVAIVQPGRGRA